MTETRQPNTRFHSWALLANVPMRFCVPYRTDMRVFWARRACAVLYHQVLSVRGSLPAPGKEGPQQTPHLAAGVHQSGQCRDGGIARTMLSLKRQRLKFSAWAGMI